MLFTALGAKRRSTFSRTLRAVVRKYGTGKQLRALVFSEPGDPLTAISARTFAPLPSPEPGEVQLRIKMAPINPSDINVIQGVYPAKARPRTDLGTPKPVFIPGNEGLGEVIALGHDVHHLQPGDRVVMGMAQAGTWSNYMNIRADALIPVGIKISDVQGATMSINPPTALTMLRHFVHLPTGDFVIQNGANSAVGQAVIQLASYLGLKTINTVRNRPDIGALKTHLQALGADHILTYDELSDRSVRDKIKEWTGGKPIRLGLNCVSGKDTTSMARLLGNNAHLVSYGAMSKAPLSLPTSLFIFKNLTAHGFMMSNWYENHSVAARRAMIDELATIFEEGALKEPTNEIVVLQGSDERIDAAVKETLRRIDAGSHGPLHPLTYPPSEAYIVVIIPRACSAKERRE